MNTSSTAIREFLSRYSPDIAAQLQGAREHVATHFPQGYELVYDNYNALVFGFGPTTRARDAVVSVAGYPRWVTLFFLRGATLPDPGHLLSGSGSRVRSIRLATPDILHLPGVQALLAAARTTAQRGFDTAPPLSTIVKSVSARQRPRRPLQPETGQTPPTAKRAARRGA